MIGLQGFRSRLRFQQGSKATIAVQLHMRSVANVRKEEFNV